MGKKLNKKEEDEINDAGSRNSDSAERTIETKPPQKKEILGSTGLTFNGVTSQNRDESPAFNKYPYIKKPGKELMISILHRKHDIKQLEMQLRRGKHRDSPNSKDY